MKQNHGVNNVVNMSENIPQNVDMIKMELPRRHRLNELFLMQQSLEFLCFLP